MGVKCTLTQKSKLKIPMDWLRTVISEGFADVPKGAEIVFVKTDGYALHLNGLEKIEVTWEERREIDG